MIKAKSIKTVKDTNDDEIDYECMTDSFEYVYLIQTVLFQNEETGHRICKIGKTVKLHNRFKSYPKNSRVYLIKRVKNCTFVESEIKRVFPTYFTQASEHGIEYFYGDVGKMIKCIEKITKASNQELEDKNIGPRVNNYYNGHIVVALGKHDEYTDPYFVEDKDDDSVDDSINTLNISSNDSSKKGKAVHICLKCNKSFTRKETLDNHVAKNACKKYTHFCEFCDKGFTTDTSMYRHVRTACKVKQEGDLAKNKIYEQLLLMKEQMKEITEENAKMKDKYKQLTHEIKKMEMKPIVTGNHNKY